MKQYVKIGNAFFREDAGTLNYVSDTDTLKALKAGTLPYKSESISRGLTFGANTGQSAPGLSFGGQPSPQNQTSQTASLNSGGTESPASTSLNGNQDLQTLFKTKFMETLNGLQNSRLPGLQARQAQIQTQALTAPIPDTSKLDPSGILNAISNRGAEYAPALQSITQEIGNEKSIGLQGIQELNALTSLMKQLSGGEIDTQVTEVNGKKLLINSKTGETIKDLGLSKVPGEGGLNPSTLTKVQTLANSFDSHPIIKLYNEVQNKSISVRGIIDSGVGGPADLALVFEFMKALDPTSVVRESEYARTASDIALLNRIRGKWEKVQTGGAGLTIDEREAIARMAKNFYQAAKKRYTDAFEETRTLARCHTCVYAEDC